jgi:hypothetical protein
LKDRTTRNSDTATLSEEDAVVERLRKLPGNRKSANEKGEARTWEPEPKVKSLLNYPEVQQTFVELAKATASIVTLESKARKLTELLAASELELEKVRQERDTLSAEVLRLNSLIAQAEEEAKIRATERDEPQTESSEQKENARRERALTRQLRKAIVPRIEGESYYCRECCRDPFDKEVFYNPASHHCVREWLMAHLSFGDRPIIESRKPMEEIFRNLVTASLKSDRG